MARSHEQPSYLGASGHRAVKAPQLLTSAGGSSLSKWVRREWLRQAPDHPVPSPPAAPDGGRGHIAGGTEWLLTLDAATRVAKSAANTAIR